MKLQLSLEFLIVFSFVLLVFIFMFALISSERSLGLSDQTFTQLQLQAQSIASAMDSALQAGNGYTGSLAVTNLIGLIPYNVTITKNGMVILQAKVGKQIIKAIAYSMAKNVVSNPSYLVSGTSNQYLIPVANGTIYLQNSFGKVCIDYQCATQSNQAEYISLSSQNVYAAQFNGAGANVTIKSSHPLLTGTQATMAVWAYWNSGQHIVGSCCGSRQEILGADSAPGYEINPIIAFNDSGTNEAETWVCTTSSCWPEAKSQANSITPGKWYFLVSRYNGSSLSLWINGVQVASTGVSGNLALQGNGNYAYIASRSNTGSYFNGKVANAQLYNSSLSANQIQQLYQEGIAGLPIPNAGLVGWWPLNGNANDYSGNGNNGVTNGPILFTSVSQFFAKVLNGNGKPLSNTLVSFASSYGPMVPQSNFTNKNGVATSFLNFNNVPGKAFVKATAYNGNYTVANSIIAWWPLNLGVGGIAYSSNSNINGFMKNSFWDMPSYYATFNTNSSYINLPQASPSANSILSVAAWFKTASGGVVLWNGNKLPPSIASCYSPVIYVTPQGYLAGGDSSSTGSLAFSTNYFVADNKWHFVVINQTTSQQTLFLDGVMIATASLTPQTCTPSNWSIGAGTWSNNIAYFNGSIANVQLYSNSLNVGQVRQLYQEGIAGLPIPNAGLVAWYPLDGDANDYSGNGNNGALYGNLNFLKNNPITESGNYSNVTFATFNPTGSTSSAAYINVPTINPINYTSFSYFAWIYPTSAESYSRVIATSAGDSGAIEVATGGSTQIMINGYNTGGWLGINSYFPLNTWNFVGATYNGSAYNVYLNGKLVWSKNVGTLLGHATPGNLQIGLTTAYPIGGNQFFGKIANVQVYSRALSLSQITQLYNAGVTGLPNSTGLVAWYPLDGNANDYSGNGNNGVPANVIYTQQQIVKPSYLYSFGSYGINFNGNSYIYNASYAPLNLQPNYTIVAMVYLNSYAGSPFIYTEGNPLVDFQFGVTTGGNLFAAAWNAKTTNNWVYTASNLVVPLRKWTFVALTLKNGGINTGTATFYVGTQNQSLSFQEENCSAAHYLGIGFNVGYLGGQAFQGLNGSIANLQIYNKALTPQQINELYNNIYPAYASTEVSMGVLP
ncbi:MAG: LamG domain-containing protein [Candidatus Micrarchaeota archaeon]